MAIGTPTERYAVQQTAQTGTTTLSPATTIAAGTVAVMAVQSTLAAKVVSSVSDNAGGNTWVVDHTYVNSTAGMGFSFISCQVATQITNSNVITITNASASSANLRIWIQEVSGLASSSVFDKSSDAVGATGTSLSNGPTATLSNTSEIVFALFGVGGAATWTKGASFSNPTTQKLGSSTVLEYAIVSANTAVTADGSILASTLWGGSLATYQAPAAASSTKQAGFRFGFR